MTRIKQTNKRVELNCQQKLEIIEKFNNGTSVKKLAGEYGVCHQTVQFILQVGSEFMTSDTSAKRKIRKYKPKLWRKSVCLPAATTTRKSTLHSATESDNNGDASDEDLIEPAWLKEMRKSKDEHGVISQYETVFTTDGSDIDFHISSKDDIGVIVESKNKISTNKHATRIVLSIEKKLEILDKLENGVSTEDLSAVYGVALNTIRDMVKRKDEYRRFASSVKNLSGVKLMILPVHDQLTGAMLKWYNEEKNKCKPVYYEDFVKQSQHIFADLQLLKRERVTSNWFKKFLIHFGIIKESKEEIILLKDKQAEIEPSWLKDIHKSKDEILQQEENSEGKTNEGESFGKHRRISRKPADYSQYETDSGTDGSDSDFHISSEDGIEVVVEPKNKKSTKKRATRVVLSIDKKLQLLDKLENGDTIEVLSAEYGVALNTIRDMVTRKDEYQRFASSVKNLSGVKQIVLPVHDRLTCAMLKWYNEQRDECKSVYYDDFVNKLKHMVVDLRLRKRVRVTNNWFEKFLTYFGILKDNKEEIIISKDEQAEIDSAWFKDIYKLKGKHWKQGESSKRKTNEGETVVSKDDKVSNNNSEKNDVHVSNTNENDTNKADTKQFNTSKDINSGDQSQANNDKKSIINNFEACDDDCSVLRKSRRASRKPANYSQYETNSDTDGSDSDFYISSEDGIGVVVEPKNKTSTKKRATRVVLSIDKKLELLDKLENGDSVEDLSAEYGVALNTIRDMVARKDEYQRFASSVKNLSGVKHMILPVHDQLTCEMLKWYNEQKSKCKSVYYKDFVKQSQHMFVDLRLKKRARVTSNWFEEFLTDFGIKKKSKEEIIISKDKQAEIEEKRVRCRKEEAEKEVKTEKKKPEVKAVYSSRTYSAGKKKRKHVELNIQGKLKMIEAFENGATALELSEKYGIGHQTVRDIVSTSEEYREFAARPDFNARLKRVAYQTRCKDGNQRVSNNKLETR